MNRVFCPLVLLIPLALACFAFLPEAQGQVSPPPDGCYPNFTTAEGCDALNSVTSGSGNTALGWRSLFLDSTASFNTGVGAGALALNNGDSNTAVGAAALLLNTSGTENTAVGADALVNNDTGSSNTANGSFALFSNIEGDRNTAIGFHALENNIANSNTAVGADVLGSNTTGINNLAVGNTALFNNTEGSGNTAIGPAALPSNIEGNDNTAVGGFALTFNTEGDSNTAFGTFALSQSTGSGNTALGRSAGANMTVADNVISIGSPGDGTAFAIGDRCFIGNIRGVTVGNADGVNVIIDSDGQLGTINSSRRFKKDVKSMDQTSEAILALKPVTFHYKNQDTKKAENTPQFGLIAEDVAEVNPDLVVRDKEGKPYTVRYDAVNAMLLNEFLKEHRKNEAQQKQIEALTAMVKEQAVQIQKVTAQQAAEIEAAGLAPGNDLESAFKVTLPPGSYTAVMSGTSDEAIGPGVGLGEAYHLQ